MTHPRWATCLKSSAFVALVLYGLIWLASLWVEMPVLASENGFLEDATVMLWSATAVISVVSFARGPGAFQRLAAVWLAAVSLLAGLRELDLHIWLNPRHLGAYGVRFRIDWWLSGDVSLLLKAGWLLFFFTIGLVLVYPPVRLRREAFVLLKGGDPVLARMVPAAFFLALGFVADDLLRHSTVVSTAARMLWEESSELIGSFLFLMAAFVQLRQPWEERMAKLVARPAPTTVPVP